MTPLNVRTKRLANLLPYTPSSPPHAGTTGVHGRAAVAGIIVRALVVAPWGTDTGKVREIGPEMGGKKLISRTLPRGLRTCELGPGPHGRHAGELIPSNRVQWN